MRSPAALRLRSGGPVVARAGPRDKVPRHDVVPAVRTSRAALVDARNVAPAHGANVVLLLSEPHHLREARYWWALRPRARLLGSRGHRTRRPLRADQPRRATARAPGGRGPTGRQWGRWSSACGNGFASSACGSGEACGASIRSGRPFPVRGPVRVPGGVRRRRLFLVSPGVGGGSPGGRGHRTQERS